MAWARRAGSGGDEGALLGAAAEAEVLVAQGEEGAGGLRRDLAQAEDLLVLRGRVCGGGGSNPGAGGLA